MSRPQSPAPAAADVEAALVQAAAPLRDAVNRNPDDHDSLVKLGNVLYDGQQYPSAIQFYERALDIHPENPRRPRRYGDGLLVHRQSRQGDCGMQTSLKYRPGHPQTLFNLGWVPWQGKADPAGAISAWEQLLKANPDYPQRQQVEQYIAEAKEHAARG